MLFQADNTWHNVQFCFWVLCYYKDVLPLSFFGWAYTSAHMHSSGHFYKIQKAGLYFVWNWNNASQSGKVLVPSSARCRAQRLVPVHFFFFLFVPWEKMKRVVRLCFCQQYLLWKLSAENVLKPLNRRLLSREPMMDERRTGSWGVCQQILEVFGR